MHMAHVANTKARPPVTVFLAASVVIFFASLSAATTVGFVPYYIDGTEPPSRAHVSEAPAPDTVALADLPQLGLEEIVRLAQGLTLAADALPEGAIALSSVEPTRIIISAIGMDLSVQNPETRDIATLDTLLQNGPARYVDSAKLGARGNVLIFAHSSNLPIVHNQMYKAFNRVPELTEGAVITLKGEDGESYLYRVRTVYKANAEDTLIDLSSTQGGMLTLVTCDTLTSKSARFVLEADYIGTKIQ